MCNCKIIPDIVLEDLKKAGYKLRGDFDLSVSQRLKRSAALIRRQVFTAMLGNGDRHIYNSANSTTQRTNLVRSEGSSPNGDIDIDKAYDNAGFVRNYYLNELGWHCIDNHGMDMIFNVHYGNSYNNAFWDGDDMSFGDGDGNHFVGFARALDVTGHELTHGVVQYTCKLLYDDQPGALNEHMADVFGSVIKQFAKGQNEHTADWLMGDEIMGSLLAGRAIRSMKDPSGSIALSPQPAHMNDYYKGSADNHGVHINSGIVNKAFYLVATKIGTFCAAKLWFAAMQKLSPTSNFVSLYNALILSISSLVSAGAVPSSAINEVDIAFKAVGII